MKKDTFLILASASPRRKQLLEQIGLEFISIASNCIEEKNTDIPSDLVLNLAKQKAMKLACDIIENRIDKSLKEILKTKEDIVILGADTVVAYKNQILGKPKDEADAKRMLHLLSDDFHNVYTGVCLLYLENSSKGVVYSKKRTDNFYESTQVHFSKLSEADIDEYISTGESFDKAGAYAIQGFAARYITKINGDYNNVVGLPLSRLWYYINID